MFLSSGVQQGAAVVAVFEEPEELAEPEELEEPEDEGKRNLGEGFPPLNALLETASSSCSSKLRLQGTQDCLVFTDTEVVEAVESRGGGTYLNPRIQPFMGCNTSVITRMRVNMTKMWLAD